MNTMNVFIDPLLFLQFIREITGGIFNEFFLTCTVYGEAPVLLFLISIIYWCIHKKTGEFLFLAMTWAGVVNSFVKITACIYRPWVMDPRVHPVEEAMPKATGYSFPSGHTANATSFFGGLALKCNFSKAITAVLCLCILLIGFSRNYLGVHSVPDVICAFIVTLILLLIVKKVFDRLDEKPDLDLAIAAAGIIASALILIYATVKSYPVDYDAAGKLIVDPAKMILDSFRYSGVLCGFSVSWIIEKRFINFSVDGNLKDKLMRIICGFIAIELIETVVIPIGKSNGPAGWFLGYFIMMVFIIVIMPLAIKYLQNNPDSNSI